MTPANLTYDRGALYYPYIHIRDENWLKATLLSFPYLERMVPAGYELNDQAAERFFSNTCGRFNKPMLRRRDLNTPEIYHAQCIVSERIEQDLRHDREAFRDRFSCEAAEQDKRFKDGRNAFQMHEYKFLLPLRDLLHEQQLIWEPSRPVRGNARWWSIDPDLGEVIMSINAVALAKTRQLDIVTSEGLLHEALAAMEPGAIYEVMVRRRPLAAVMDQGHMVNDLMRFVIYDHFDLASLPNEQVVELSRQRADVSSLKAELARLLQEVGTAPDREIWEDQLKEKSQEAIAHWRDRVASVGGFLERLIGQDLGDEASGFLKDVTTSALGGTAVSLAVASALPGFVVGAIFYVGKVAYAEIKADQTSPFRFFSRLVRAGAKHKEGGHILSFGGPAIAALPTPG
jgi:hypothetical protein